MIPNAPHVLVRGRPRPAWAALLALGLMAAVALEASVEGEKTLDQSLPGFVPGPPLQGKLHSVGADTMDVITFGWIQMFRRAYPEMEVTMEARSSLTAAPALINGLAEIAPVAQEFPPSEKAIFQQKFGYPPLLIRVAGGSYMTANRSHALAVYVHRDNPLRRLSLDQLDAIFSSSRKRGHREVTTWGDLGLEGEWASRPITLYSIRRPNGIVNYFQHRVLQEGEFKATVRERANSNDSGALAAVVASIAADPGGIGYAGFAHATPAVRSLALAEKPEGPFIAGTLATVADHSYPLSRWIYIAVNRPPGQPLSPAVRAFLQLVLSRDGQAIVAQDVGFLPLPASVAHDELAKLD